MEPLTAHTQLQVEAPVIEEPCRATFNLSTTGNSAVTLLRSSKLVTIREADDDIFTPVVKNYLTAK
ncbi:hypothetical protein F7725_007821 [Dissostichus mawsoni]|uniref:Uncharacterized protein n=1 Tax=Dissostichus mawsoni TaxID=36200 RepID=A0A7J5Y8G9_DISMA|nr:hypothetical protein F7725_007821 [Dissostichus mawsoni]